MINVLQGKTATGAQIWIWAAHIVSVQAMDEKRCLVATIDGRHHYLEHSAAETMKTLEAMHRTV